MNESVWHPASEWPEKHPCRVLLSVAYDPSDYWYSAVSGTTYDIVTGDYCGNGYFDPDWLYNGNEVMAWAIVDPWTAGDEEVTRNMNGVRVELFK